MQKHLHSLIFLISAFFFLNSCKLDPVIIPDESILNFKKQTLGQSRQVPERKIISIPQYLANVPRNYNAHPGYKWPLMINLHGTGEKGDDSAEIVRTETDLSKAVDKNNLQFILISPQLTKAYTAWYTPDLDSLLVQLKEKYSIDEKRVMIIGYSLGARGVWGWTMEKPNHFSCSVPIAGWGEADKAGSLVNLPIWAFHNKYDDYINAYSTTSIIDAIKAAGGTKAKVTLYEASGHGGWPETYKNPEVVKWMLAQQNPTPN